MCRNLDQRIRRLKGRRFLSPVRDKVMIICSERVLCFPVRRQVMHLLKTVGHCRACAVDKRQCAVFDRCEREIIIRGKPARQSVGTSVHLCPHCFQRADLNALPVTALCAHELFPLPGEIPVKADRRIPVSRLMGFCITAALLDRMIQ